MTSIGRQVLNKWVLLAVALAAVLAAVVAMQPVLAQDSTIEYAENGTDPVATFTADDPEGDTVTWTVTGGADQASFSIGANDGVLEFDSPPDYEGGATTGGGDSDNDNTYEVIVTATDSAPTPNAETYELHVKVTNVDETGKVVWTVDPDGAGALTAAGVNGGNPIVQFQVGAILTIPATFDAATGGVTDGDVQGPTKDVTERLQWSRASSKAGPWTAISGAAGTGASYTVTTDDIGMYIQVEAFYNVGSGREESASLASDYPVLGSRSNNEAPEFSPTAVMRTISEGKKGITVGAPVTATDDITNELNYILAGVDRGRFKIDGKTGQITTDMDLDFDEATTLGTDGGTEDQCVARNSCVVEVTATDSAGLASSPVATVTIKITDVNEKPTFAAPDTSPTPPTNLMSADNPENATPDLAAYTATDPEGRSLTYHLMGPDAAKFELSATRVLSFRENPDYEMPADANRDNVYEVTVRASDGVLYDERMVEVTVTNQGDAPIISGPKSVNYAENGTGTVATFTAMDPDGDTVTWSALGGLDAADFAINMDGELTFNATPDYEDPQDDGTNNTYNIEVNATDGTNPSMAYTVEVKVTNQNETGKVTWTVDPAGTPGVDVLDTDNTPLLQFQVGAVLAASVEDGDISGSTKAVTVASNSLTWRWYRGGTQISNQTDPSYTVTSSDVGNRIRVTAFYTVGTGREESASLTAGYPVLDTRSSNDAPEFSPATVSREVAEGDKGARVGNPVTATDDITNQLNYVLGGADRARFKIDQKSGQITTDVDLDFDQTTLGTDGGTEDQCLVRNMCVVTVTATDSAGEASSAATVNIEITDVNEKPAFGAIVTTDGSEANIVSADYAEDATGADANIATYTATDPETLNVNLTLMGRDADQFTLDTSGVLTFESAPDYEMPADSNRDNRYEVTVRASDGVLHTDKMVIVTVTDVNEAPTVMSGPAMGVRISGPASVSYLENGTGAVETYTATGMDADTARWTLEGDDAGDFSLSASSGESTMLMFRSSPNYEAPVDADSNNVYMVTVKATVGTESDTQDVRVTVTNDENEPDTPLARYDRDNSGAIEKSEMFTAINDYLYEDTISQADMFAVINLYLFP